jgi:hypothetical protein
MEAGQTATKSMSEKRSGGILPPGDANKSSDRGVFSSVSAGQDAQLYDRRDARRYNQV